MYEDREEDWGTPETVSTGFESTSEPISENVSPEEDTLVVPTKEVKGKNKKAKRPLSEKKPIPKKQLYILGGIAFAVVIIAGGGLTYAHMLQQQEVSIPPANKTSYHPPVSQASSMTIHGNIPSINKKTPDDMQGISHDTPNSQTSGFATLGSLPQPPVINPIHHSTLKNDDKMSPVTTVPPTANNILPIMSKTTPTSKTTSSYNGETTNINASDLSSSNQQDNNRGQLIVSELKEKERISQRKIEKMHMEVQETKQKISNLESELKAAENNVGKPQIITRTVVRYVHVPVNINAPSIPVRKHQIAPVQNHSGISVIGGNEKSAIISDREGQVITIYRGDRLPNGDIVQSIHNGYIMTNHGIIR